MPGVAGALREGVMYIGIDVQAARPCPYAVLSEALKLVDSGWLPLDSLRASLQGLVAAHPNARFGIDAPRRPLPSPREWYWRRDRWRRRTSNERGHGRHCEIVIKAHTIANPQWTPLRADAPEWMRNGFTLFEALEGRAPCHEVFPSASYTLLEGEHAPIVSLDFSGFRPGPKDMLDAVVAAVTVAEFEAGRGTEVGGGDGLGTIVLPRRLPQAKEKVLSWPDD